MATVEETVQPLKRGDRLTREEFLRIWDAHPEIKNAELIGGIVYMASPVSAEHGDMDGVAGGWAFTYTVRTPGTVIGHNATSLLLEDAPQADINVRILPECGGRSRREGLYLGGTPELFVEICGSSASYDLHEKLDLYQSAGIPEYLAILMYEREIRWHQLVNGTYQRLPPDADGIWRSRILPGLWLDGTALLADDAVRLLAKLDEGLRSPEHQAFVDKLAQARASQASGGSPP
jgi:Uma2 family endonuclease